MAAALCGGCHLLAPSPQLSPSRLRLPPLCPLQFQPSEQLDVASLPFACKWILSKLNAAVSGRDVYVGCGREANVGCVLRTGTLHL